MPLCKLGINCQNFSKKQTKCWIKVPSNINYCGTITFCLHLTYWLYLHFNWAVVQWTNTCDYSKYTQYKYPQKIRKGWFWWSQKFRQLKTVLGRCSLLFRKWRFIGFHWWAGTNQMLISIYVINASNCGPKLAFRLHKWLREIKEPNHLNFSTK